MKRDHGCERLDDVRAADDGDGGNGEPDRARAASRNFVLRFRWSSWVPRRNTWLAPAGVVAEEQRVLRIATEAEREELRRIEGDGGSVAPCGRRARAGAAEIENANRSRISGGIDAAGDEHVRSVERRDADAGRPVGGVRERGGCGGGSRRQEFPRRLPRCCRRRRRGRVRRPTLQRRRDEAR